MQDELILRRILYKLFHIEESIEQNAHEVKTRNKTLVGLREEQSVHDKALEEARKEQAQARSNVMQKEKKVKKAEKAVDAKVRCFPFSFPVSIRFADK
jgi:structural maintenance of chromosome 1